MTGWIREVHEANYECYGYRRTHAQLVREGERAERAGRDLQLDDFRPAAPPLDAQYTNNWW